MPKFKMFFSVFYSFVYLDKIEKKIKNISQLSFIGYNKKIDF